MECSSGSSTINKSNIMCVRISFEICVKRALLNYTHKQQDTIKKMITISCEHHKLTTRYNYKIIKKKCMYAIQIARDLSQGLQSNKKIIYLLRIKICRLAGIIKTIRKHTKTQYNIERMKT